MKNTADPSVHRQRERQFVEHVERLLVDPRLRPETLNGAKPITTLMPQASRSDRAMDLKNEMVRRGSSDRDLQNRMPVGEQIDVALSTKKWLIFKKPVGRMRVVCLSPTASLLGGEESKPMTQQEVTRLIASQPPPLGGVPTTLVVMATHGFALEAHEVTDRRPDRTVILVEPNDAGGWSVYGPPEQKALVDLFDPEADQEKRTRVREVIAADQTELLTGGLSADRIATRAQLPLQLVESELKSYAKQNPGLQAKRLDGHVVLFREGSAPVSSGSAGATGAAAAGGGEANMPLIDRIKSLFARKGENEKKIAVLSEQKAAFAQQLDRSYEEIGALEKKEQQLRDDFKANNSSLTRRRITGQMVQLRKDIERRQQLIGVLNQRVNVVSTHLHNLELVRQGNTSKLPDAEELANDAAAAEEMLAELQASNELADGVGSGVATAGMSAEEQALYEELERESGGGAQAAQSAERAAPSSADRASASPATPSRAPARASTESPKRAEPEAG